MILYRGITRKTEDSFWPHISYKIEGRLGQAATLSGLEGISPGHSIELIPYGVMRGFRALDTRDFTNPYFQKATAQGQPGMDAKFVIHDHFVVDMTANPDFSQVESEDPQITVNQRFAVYFPEKRPFFLENEDFFRTPLDLFFTRSIGDPSAGIRLTGKDGPYSVGLMADRRSQPRPGCARLRPALRHPLLFHGCAREPRHLPPVERGRALHRLGMSHDRGIQPHRRRRHSPEIQSQLDARRPGRHSSSNLNLNCEANLYPFSSGNRGNNNYYAGPADKLELRRDGLHFSYDGIYNDISPGFVTVPGFVNRVDIRETMQEADYRFRPKKGWIVDWGPSLIARYDFDHTGLRLDTDYVPYFAIQGRGQTLIILRPYEEFRERLRPQDFCFYGYSLYCSPTTLGNQDYHEHTSGASIQTGYFKKATLNASYYWGQGVNFVASPPATLGTPTPYNQPYLAREDSAQADADLASRKAVEDREHLPVRAPAHQQQHLSLRTGAISRRGPGNSSTITSYAASGTGSSRLNFRCG